MPELAHVLLPKIEPKVPKLDKRSSKWLRKQRADWMEQQKLRLHCALSWAACQPRPWQHMATAVTEQGNTEEQQVPRTLTWAIPR